MGKLGCAGAVLTVAAALCCPAPLCAAPAAQPVPGVWKGVCSQPGAEFALEYDAKIADGKLYGDYIFSSGSSIVKGSFSGTQTGSNVYSVRVHIPAGTQVPQFNIVFPDPQVLAGTLRIGQRQPEFKAAFSAFPDMTLVARFQLLGPSQFSARWVAQGLAGAVQFRRIARLSYSVAKPRTIPVVAPDKAAVSPAKPRRPAKRRAAKPVPAQEQASSEDAESKEEPAPEEPAQ